MKEKNILFDKFLFMKIIIILYYSQTIINLLKIIIKNINLE